MASSRAIHKLVVSRQAPLRSLDRRRTGIQISRRLQSTYINAQHESTQPRTRSRTFRTIYAFFKFTGLATATFVAGIAYAMYDHNNLKTMLAQTSAIASSPKTSPTPAETLSSLSYTPPDAATTAINTHILTSPLATALRTHPHNYTEWRPHLQIPPALRPTNLTGGTLLGPGRIAVPPLMFNDKQGKNMVALFYLGEQLCGHPGIVHGGLLATLLDEGLARCCFPALPNKVGVTANLKVEYRRPARAEKYYVLRAETVKVEGRKAWVKGWIEEMGDVSGENGEAVKLVEAEALYVEPRNAKWMKKLYAVETP